MVYSKASVSTIIVSVLLPFLAAGAVAARFGARKFRSKSGSFYVDDYLITLALVAAYGEGIFCIWGSVRAGIGAYVPSLDPATLANFEKALFAVILIHLSVLTIIKISVLLFYKRIFTTPQFTLIVNIAVGLVICWWLTFFIGAFFVTTPLSDWWTKEVPVFNFDWAAFIQALAALDIVGDVLILCLPIPMIRKLHMNVARKVQLVAIFWLGFFCVAFAAVRLYYVIEFGVIGGPGSPKFTNVVEDNFIWAEIEPCTSIIAACLPTLGPLLQTWRGPDSIVNSVRSIFSVHSNESTSRRNGDLVARTSLEGSETSSSLVRAAWIELGEGGKHKADVTASYNHDIELGTLDSRGQHGNAAILVKKTFAADTSQE